MAIGTDRTPNPNALKFTVGTPVGGPVTYTEANAADSPLAQSLLAIPGVVSMFMTADFVTLTKTGESSWSDIEGAAVAVLEDHFG
jgi:hypothetical protein